MNYEEAWKLLKKTIEEKFDRTDDIERKIAFSQVIGLMEAYEEKQNPGE